jgi:hypothetical protein
MKTIYCCERCADEFFGTHNWTSYDDIADCSMDTGTVRNRGGQS